jgi:excisionase family DNA binding protein
MLRVTNVTLGIDKHHLPEALHGIKILVECVKFHKAVWIMIEMLTAKDIQELFQVDRSTVYRMAEAGQLPAIKVGKQWRFPKNKMDEWFQTRMMAPMQTAVTVNKIDSLSKDQPHSLADLLPIDCVQLIQDSFADLLDVMLVITDMEGKPITEPSHPCGLFDAINNSPDAIQKCIQSWHDLAMTIDLAPKYSRSHLGLLCARSMIRVGHELKGMVIVGCIEPETWPPSQADIETIAADFDVDSKVLLESLHEIYQLDDGRKQEVLTFLPRIANIIAHIVNERNSLVGRLEAIASLTQLKEY